MWATAIPVPVTVRACVCPCLRLPCPRALPVSDFSLVPFLPPVLPSSHPPTLPLPTPLYSILRGTQTTDYYYYSTSSNHPLIKRSRFVIQHSLHMPYVCSLQPTRRRLPVIFRLPIVSNPSTIDHTRWTLASSLRFSRIVSYRDLAATH